MSQYAQLVKPVLDFGKGLYDEIRGKERQRVEQEVQRHEQFMTKFDQNVQEADAQQEQLHKSMVKLGGLHDVTRTMTNTREEIGVFSELRRQQLEQVKNERDRIEQQMDKANAALSDQPTPPPMPGKCDCEVLFYV